MGLGGFVRCRCWQDAKVTPPAALADLIIFADGDVSLSVSWESHPGLNNDLDEWIYSSPCSHEDMEQAHEGVGNWAAYRAFQRELTTLGQFPTLTAELPNSNNGFSPTSSATAALTELQLFTELCGVRDTAVLHDTDTDEIIWEQLHAFGGANVITAEGEMGVDPNGFWIRRDGAEVFRAMHLTRFLNGKLRNLAVRTQPLSPEVHNPTVTALTKPLRGLPRHRQPGRLVLTVRFVKGDATSPQAKGPKLIVHICNDLGGWGKGFVLAISKRWSEPEKAYREWHRGHAGNDFGLGATQLVQVKPDTWVANAVAQRGMRTGSKGPPIRYDAVRRCLETVASHAERLGASVHMPRIGCGLAGGRWPLIEPIITETLVAKGIAVTIYDFD